MIAYKKTDYVLYFDMSDIQNLMEDWIIPFPNLQHVTEREPAKFNLKTKEELQSLSQKKPGMLVFQNEAMLVVVHLTESEPTEHVFYFEKTWFIEMIEIVKNSDSGYTLRWNGSGDKITILAGKGSEAKKFKVMFGP